MPGQTKIIVLTLITLLLAGCGYRLAGQMSGNGGAVAITGFTNKTLRPNLDSCLASQLVEAVSAAGMTVAPLERSSLDLSGAILTYTESASSFNAEDKVATYQSSMTAEAKLRNIKSGDTLWKGVVRGVQDYPTSTDIALKLNAQEAALQELCRKLSDEMIRQMGNSF